MRSRCVKCCGVGRGFVVMAAVAAGLYGAAALAQGAPPAGAPPQTEPQQGEQPQGAQPQGAQTPGTSPQNPGNDAVSNMIGAWEFSNADHDKICHFNFRSDQAPQGYRVDVDKNCPSLFPSTKQIVAWAVDNYGGLRLLDEHGEAVIELTLVEGGMYDGFKPEEGRYILQAAAAVQQLRTADDLVGDWAFTRSGGKPICMLSLINATAQGSTDNLALKIKSGCDALVTRFGPTSWKMDNGELVLVSARGQIWRFEENDINTWQRLPETADPVLLVRQQ